MNHNYTPKPLSFAPLTALVFASFLLQSAVFFWLVPPVLQASANAFAQHTAAQLADELAAPQAVGDTVSAAVIAKRYEQERLAFIGVYDQKGQIYLTFGMPPEGVLAQNGTDAAANLLDTNAPNNSYYAPIKQDGTTLGGVQLVVKTTTRADVLRHFWLYFLAGALGHLLLWWAAHAWLARRFLDAVDDATQFGVADRGSSNLTNQNNVQQGAKHNASPNATNNAPKNASTANTNTTNDNIANSDTISNSAKNSVSAFLSRQLAQNGAGIVLNNAVNNPQQGENAELQPLVVSLILVDPNNTFALLAADKQQQTLALYAGLAKRCADVLAVEQAFVGITFEVGDFSANGCQVTVQSNKTDAPVPLAATLFAKLWTATTTTVLDKHRELSLFFLPVRAAVALPSKQPMAVKALRTHKERVLLLLGKKQLQALQSELNLEVLTHNPTAPVFEKECRVPRKMNDAQAERLDRLFAKVLSLG